MANYTLTNNLTNCKIATAGSSQGFGDVSFTVDPASGYHRPEQSDISITGSGSIVSYNKNTGVLVIRGDNNTAVFFPCQSDSPGPTPPTSFTVTVNQATYSAPSSGDDNEVFDGQDTETPSLGIIPANDHNNHTYTVTSGYIFIYGGSESGGGEGRCTGGVSYIGGSPSGSTGYLYSVTANGAIQDFEFSCLVGDTLITMSDYSQKRIDEIELGDEVLSIDWDTKSLVSRKVIFTNKDFKNAYREYDEWTFEDGTIIKTVHKHEFYNIEKQGMTYMDQWNIGDHAININGQAVALVKHQTVKEEVNHYKITLEDSTNFFANGLLNGDRDNPKNVELSWLK